jgi:MFS family permease
LSIVLFSLFIDKFGYGRAMVFAIVWHLSSAIITIFASGYTMLYLGTFIVALGNGAVEAVINPVVATVHSKEKTKWLNILHAGWPGGMVLGGLLILAMGPEIHWKWKVGLIILPTLVYGLMLLRCQFPVHERVRAGISYKTMLQEAGILGALIVIAIMTAEIGRIFTWSLSLQIGIAGGLLLAYGVYVRSGARYSFFCC